MTRFFVRFGALAWLATAAATFQSSPSLAADLNYNGLKQVSLAKLLPPPPSADSIAQQRDLKAVLDAQTARNEAQIKRAQQTAELSVFEFADVLGPNFTPDKLPKTAKLFKAVYDDTLVVLADGKKLWNRPRPFLASTEVSPVGSRPKSGSYPSGNALLGYLYAIILSDLIPEKKQVLFDRGNETGDNRVIVGVHYPTDLEAGRRAAVAIAVALYESPAYAADLDGARSEVRAALGL